MKTKHPGLNSSHVPESDVKIEIDVNKYKIDNISKMENAVFRITNASETSLSGTQQIDNVVMGWELNQQNPAISLADVQVLNFADDNFESASTFTFSVRGRASSGEWKRRASCSPDTLRTQHEHSAWSALRKREKLS